MTTSRIVGWVVVLGVAVLVGRGVWQEQQAALERCAPGCDTGSRTAAASATAAYDAERQLSALGYADGGGR